MLFMVIERFSAEKLGLIGERFKERGRMLPDGVVYHASWMAADGSRCYQVMEAADAAALRVWTARWDDLVEFEIVPVQTSAEYWSKARSS